ncbi:hypothetical protein AVEN_135497-1 [Araneus ventricosus]|uniref:Uncharacterized protein n=1 Tax=Araneus ventricosus TaxID=182803 RepID=A0A4Y2BDT6_ARAVE|nr:hypothetical protein AVEN_135497-1 [Araneus ventricosus]
MSPASGLLFFACIGLLSGVNGIDFRKDYREWLHQANDVTQVTETTSSQVPDATLSSSPEIAMEYANAISSPASVISPLKASNDSSSTVSDTTTPFTDVSSSPSTTAQSTDANPSPSTIAQSTDASPSPNDKSTPDRTLAIAELLESEDFRHMDGPSKPSD